MAGEVTYFAIVGAGRSAQTPSRLARRRYAAVGPVDETLRRDLTWKPDSAIVQWEYGEVGADLIEISEADADRLVAMFRLAWDQPG